MYIYKYSTKTVFSQFDLTFGCMQRKSINLLCLVALHRETIFFVILSLRRIAFQRKTLSNR